MSDDPREVPPDAHLLAALRHAPDGQAAPPPGLSALILAQARQAAATAPRVPWARRWGQALQALDRLLPRPALGGALATVALATVIGVMWRGGPPVDRDEPSLADVTAPVVAPAPEPAPLRQAPAMDSRNEAPAPQVPSAGAPTAAAPTPSARRAQPGPRAGPPTPARAAAKAPAAVPAQVAAVPEAPRSADLQHMLASAQTAASGALASASAPPPRPLAALLAALRDHPATVQVLPGPGDSPRAEMPFAPAEADAARERSVAGPRLARKALASAAADTSEGHEWLAQVAQAAEGRWQPVATPTLAAGEPGHVIQIGGVPAGRLVLTGSGVLWLPSEASGPAWQAGLEAPVLQALRAQAPRH